MKEALDAGKLSEEALSFLNGTRASQKDPQGADATGAKAETTPADTNPADEQEPSDGAGCSSWKQSPGLSVVLPAIVSLTFRLPANLAYRLAKVAAERKLQRECPFTQQDIVADALARWLDRHTRRG